MACIRPAVLGMALSKDPMGMARRLLPRSRRAWSYADWSVETGNDGKGVCGEPGGNEGCTGLVWTSKRRFWNHHIAGESHPTGLDSESGSHQFIPRPAHLGTEKPRPLSRSSSLFFLSQEMSSDEMVQLLGCPWKLAPHVLFIRALHGIVDLDAARPASRILNLPRRPSCRLNSRPPIHPPAARPMPRRRWEIHHNARIINTRHDHGWLQHAAAST